MIYNEVAHGSNSHRSRLYHTINCNYYSLTAVRFYTHLMLYLLKVRTHCKKINIFVPENLLLIINYHGSKKNPKRMVKHTQIHSGHSYFNLSQSNSINESGN